MWPYDDLPSSPDIAANLKLNEMGSVMGREQEPAWRRDNPLLGTAMQMLDTILGGISPTDAGGGKGAVLGPIRTAGQKQAVKALWRADPDILRAVQADPRILQINVPGGVGGLRSSQFPTGQALGTYSSNRITMAPSTMRGIKPSGLTGASLPEIMLHEGQHFLNEPRIYGRNIGDPSALAKQIYPFLSPGATSNAVAATSSAAKSHPGIPGLDKLALDEALAYLSGKGTRNPKLATEAEGLYQALKPGPNAIAINPQNIESAVFNARESTSKGLMADVLDAIRQMTGR